MRRLLMILFLMTICTLLPFAHGCATSTPLVTKAPLRLNPPIGGYVVELAVPDWVLVCIRRVPAQPQRYTCLEVGHLRNLIQPGLKAN